MIRIELPEYRYVFQRWELPNYSADLDYELKDRGVYILLGKSDEVLYVGKSRRIRSRLRGHVRGKDSSGEFGHLIEKIAIIEVKRLPDLDIYESYAINELKPRFNRDKVFYREEDIKVLEYELLIAEGERERYREIIACLSGEDYSSLQQEDLRIAEYEYMDAKQQIRRISQKLDDVNR